VQTSLFILANTSNYNSNISFEGIYQIDSTTKEFTYKDLFYPASTGMYGSLADSINAQSESPGADTYLVYWMKRVTNFASKKTTRQGQ